MTKPLHTLSPDAIKGAGRCPRCACRKVIRADFPTERCGSFYARELASPPCAGASTAPHVYQHAAGLVWDSPCHCWKLGVAATINECLPKPQIQFLVDLSSLGNIAH